MTRYPVVVVEDDPITRRLLQAHLTRWGVTPTMLVDGQSGLDHLCRMTGPCVAILDWMLPLLSGIDICRHIREKNLPVYVIMLTVKSGMTNIDTATEAGSDDFLTKPWHMEELRVRLLLAQRILSLQVLVDESRKKP